MTNMIIYSIANIILLLLGIQIQKNELLLLSGKYNYKTGAAQWITFITALIALSISVNHLLAADILLEVLTTIIVVLIFVVSEYLLAHVRPSRAVYSWSWRFAVTLVCTWVCNELAIAMGGDVRPVIPFIAAGFYLRNTPFGITHGKDLWIAHYMQRNPDIAFDDNADDTTDMPDCSFAGMKRRGKATTVFDVTAFGIVPNSSADQTEAIQRVIDAASKAGGGKVYFPKGRYLINTKGDKFLQINHSDITLQKYDQNTETFDALKDGRGVALAHDNALLWAWAKENPNFDVAIGKLGEPENIAPAVKKGDQALLAWVNSEIAAMKQDGRLVAAYEKTLRPVYGDKVKPEELLAK